MPQVIRIYHCDDSEAFTRLVRHWLDEHDDPIVGAPTCDGIADSRCIDDDQLRGG